MTICELCGAKGTLVKAEVEGVPMSLCEKCSKYGKVYTPPKQAILSNTQKQHYTHPTPPETTEEVVEDIGTILKQTREKRQMTQEEFAKRLAVKESFLHKIESGVSTPDIHTAKKWGHILGVQLVKETEQQTGIISKNPQAKSNGLTIGDMIKR